LDTIKTPYHAMRLINEHWRTMRLIAWLQFLKIPRIVYFGMLKLRAASLDYFRNRLIDANNRLD